MRRARTSIVATGIAFTLILAACGSDDDGADSADAGDTGDSGDSQDTDDGGDSGDAGDGGDGGLEGTLRVLVHQNPPMVAYMEGFNAAFEEANPGVSIDFSIVGADDLGTSNQTRLSADDIDVTTISLSGFANPVQDYMTDVDPPAWQTLIEAGLLMDLTDEPWVDNYSEEAIADGGSYEGSVYGIPLGRVSYSGMFVNETLLADVGVEIPETWDDLVAACEAIKDSGNACMTAGGADGWPIFVGSYGLLGSFYPDQEALAEGLWTGEIKWDDPESVEMFRRYQVYATEMLEPGVTGLAHDAAIARYAAGDVAFAPTGVWQGPALEGANPEFDWTYVPFPGSDDPADNQFLFGKYDQSWAVAADTPNRELAMAYLEAFSQPDAYQAFVDAVGFLPTQPTATLDSRTGEAVAPLLDNFRVGFEQWWIQPTGAGQWANGSHAASWFAPYNEWDDPEALAEQAQADLEAGLEG